MRPEVLRKVLARLAACEGKERQTPQQPTLARQQRTPQPA